MRAPVKCDAGAFLYLFLARIRMEKLFVGQGMFAYSIAGNKFVFLGGKFYNIYIICPTMVIGNFYA